jgi:Ser/Thr protein kinase RdoA (MazF antagonist)
MLLIPRPAFLRRLAAKASRQKTNWPAAEVEAVLAHYDLGPWQMCQTLAGGNSDNVLLQTGEGKKVLKRYYWSLPSTEQEHSILGHLAETDFPAPRLTPNQDGLTYTQVGDKHYALYDFIDGYCSTNYFLLPGTRRRLVAQAGATLARFHHFMAGFVPEGRKLNGYKPDGVELWRDVAWHLDVLAQYVENTSAKKSLDRKDTFVLSIADQLGTDLSEVGRHYEPTAPQLPRMVIHGDYSPKNLLFNRERVAAVLDLGDACVNLRALDVAWGLTTFSYTNNRNELDIRLARTFLQAYQVHQPLEKQEIEAIPDLIRWRHLRNIVWKLRGTRPDQQSPDAWVSFIRDRWEDAGWTKVHTGELRASLLSIS